MALAKTNGTMIPPTTDRGVKTRKSEFPFAVGCDWITLTTPKDDAGFALYDIANRYWDNTGAQAVDWSNKWYTGRSGNGLSWGIGQNGYVLISSGEAVPSVWIDGILTRSRVTRLDLQVTVKLPVADPGLPAKWYDAVVEQGLHKRRMYGIIKNSKGGQTLYAGSRNSDQYGRFYDKGVESKRGRPGTVYRYEIELKKPRSGTFAAAIVEDLIDGTFPAKDVAFYIYNWWVERGVTPLFSPTNGRNIVTFATRLETDTEKKLHWIRTQVAPTVSKLLDRVGKDDVYAALGIDNLS